jgi:hypothetical protein
VPGLAAATREQQMSCAFHEMGFPRERLLQLREVTRELLVDLKGRRIPPTIRDEPVMVDVEATEVFDVEMGSEVIPEVAGGKQAKGQCNTTPAAEFDLAAVQTVIQAKMTRLLNRINEDRWRAVD